MSTFQSIQNQMVNPIMARYNRDMGVSIGIIGVVVGIFSIAALIVRPVSGTMSDRIDNKKLSSISAVCMGIATVGYVISGENVAMLIMFRFLHGIAFGICGTTLMRMASCLVPYSRMGEGMGYFGMGQVLSIAIAPTIGLTLADNFGYGTTFIVSAAVICLVGVMCLFIAMPKEEHVKKKKSKWKFSDLIAKEAVGFAVVACMLFFANSIENNFIVLYGEELGIRNIGIYFTVGAIAMFIIRILTGRLVDKKGLGNVLIPAIICVAIAMLVLAAAGSMPLNFVFAVIMLASVIKAMGHGTAQPALQTACIQSVEPQRKGIASSTFYMGCDIGMGVGPIAGGAIAGAVGFQGLYIAASAVALAGLLIFLVIRKSKIRTE